MTPWRTKALQIVDSLCVKAYRESRKNRKPYYVPDSARDLIECLNRSDERGAKTLMAWDYEISIL